MEGEGRFSWVYRLGDRLHTTTRPEVIRRELLFAEGDCFDPLVLTDSERLLRNLPFVAEAEVRGVRLPGGGVRVTVATRDDWSKRVELQTSSRGGFQATGVEIREANLVGTGQQLSAYFRRSLEERVYGVEYETPQLFRSQIDGTLAFGQSREGGYFLSETLALPFRGESGRWAWRQHFEHNDRYFQLVKPQNGELLRVLLPERRQRFDAGGVFRLGERGNFSLFGLALSGEWASYPDGVRLRDPDRFPAADSALLDTARVGLDPVENIRLMVLVGQRNVYFVRRGALDAVRGGEDVRLGIETELGVGRSLQPLSEDDELALEFGFGAAGELPGNVLVGGQLRAEAKRDFERTRSGDEWTDLLAQLDAWSYWRPHPKHTLVAALTGAGGWRTTVPFQVTLGSGSGLRGYPRDYLPGAQRVAGTLEIRSFVGWPYPRLFDLGTAAFVDAGRVWAGDDPFGIDSPWQLSGGVGLRAAFPPESRRTYRLDVAFPLVSDFGATGVRLTFGVGQAVGRRATWVDPQIRRSSRRTIAASLFSFPN